MKVRSFGCDMFCIQINRKNKFPEKMADPEEDGESEKRYFKLNVHTPSFFPEDLIIRFVTPFTPNPSGLHSNRTVNFVKDMPYSQQYPRHLCLIAEKFNFTKLQIFTLIIYI